MSQIVYTASRTFLRVAFWTLGGLEVHGLQNLPMTGPLIVACNHASHLDPMVLGAAFPRPLNFLARRTLFDVPVFRWLIHHNNAFPLDREGDPREALRTFGERLDQGAAVVMFPEGTRSSDGALGEIRPGVGMLAVRNYVPVLPVFVWGSYQSWPRGRGYPKPHHLKALMGEVIVPNPDKTLRKSEQLRINHEVGAALRRLEKQAWQGEKNPPPALVEAWRKEEAGTAGTAPAPESQPPNEGDAS